ncbi:MAG: LytR/AlgR family response regulator transcription factor [Lachnospiraceae bacterium]
MILYDKVQKEQERLKKVIKDAVAYFSEEQLEMVCVLSPKAVQEFLDGRQILDLACMDVSGGEDIRLLRSLRGQYEESELLLVADTDISPMEYLTPDIRAASLLLRPFEGEQCRQIIWEFFRSFYQSREQVDEKKVLLLENRNGKTAIPFHQIYYIEVREKKIHIRLKNKEYSRYDSMEGIMKVLPDSFVRCHRSFVFNAEHLERVKLSENMIYLEHGIMVPLSRSYKPEVKEFVDGLRSG